MTDLSELMKSGDELPKGALEAIARRVCREYSPEDPENDPEGEGLLPLPITEEPDRIVRIPASKTWLAGCEVLWQGGTLVLDGTTLWLRYDDGRVDGCLLYEHDVAAMILKFYGEGECWR